MCEAYKDSKKYAKKLFEINQQDQSSSQASDNVTTMPPITLSLNGTGLAIMKSQVNEPILVGSSAVRNNSDVFSTKSLNFACSNGICWTFIYLSKKPVIVHLWNIPCRPPLQMFRRRSARRHKRSPSAFYDQKPRLVVQNQIATKNLIESIVMSTSACVHSAASFLVQVIKFKQQKNTGNFSICTVHFHRFLSTSLSKKFPCKQLEIYFFMNKTV